MQNQGQRPKIELKYRVFHLSLEIIRFLESLEYRQAIKIIANQLIRAVTSIGANIVEAKSAVSKREFLKFFEISLKSAQETKYWLAMLRELLPDQKDKINGFLRETEEIAKILSASILTMKGKRSLKFLI